MRDIKFEICVGNMEGKALYTDIFTLDRLINRNGTMLNAHEKVLWKRECTGLKDKNGVEIYEGDIVKAKTCKNDICNLLGRVIFEEGEYLIEQDDDCFPLCTFSVIDYGSFEIIGNHFENPELLKEQQ